MMKQITQGARQGDVLLIAVGQIRRLDQNQPAGGAIASPEDGRLVLAHGEATGHHHSFGARAGITLFRDDTLGPYLVEVTGPAALEHQEHASLTMAPSPSNTTGRFHVLRQRVYQGGMTRKVED